MSDVRHRTFHFLRFLCSLATNPGDRISYTLGRGLAFIGTNVDMQADVGTVPDEVPTSVTTQIDNKSVSD
jgi:hypothetical protein